MAWETLTAADVISQFNDSETSAYETAKGTKAAVDLASGCTFVTNALREAIGGRDIGLGPDGTIPSGFKLEAIAKARWQFLLSLPTGKSLQTPERQKESETFDTLIKGIRDGSIKVQPGDGTPNAMALPQVSEKRHRFGRRHESGI